MLMGLWNQINAFTATSTDVCSKWRELFSVWSTLLTAHVVGDVLCMYAVKYWGGMWSSIHEMLKGEVLQTILDSILVGISH